MSTREWTLFVVSQTLVVVTPVSQVWIICSIHRYSDHEPGSAETLRGCCVSIQRHKWWVAVLNDVDLCRFAISVSGTLGSTPGLCLVCLAANVCVLLSTLRDVRNHVLLGDILRLLIFCLVPKLDSWRMRSTCMRTKEVSCRQRCYKRLFLLIC